MLSSKLVRMQGLPDANEVAARRLKGSFGPAALRMTNGELGASRVLLDKVRVQLSPFDPWTRHAGTMSSRALRGIPFESGCDSTRASE